MSETVLQLEVASVIAEALSAERATVVSDMVPKQQEGKEQAMPYKQSDNTTQPIAHRGAEMCRGVLK